MRGIGRTLAYLIIFFVFTVESIEMTSQYLQAEKTEELLYTTSSISQASTSVSETFDFSSENVEFGPLRSPAAILLSALCMLKLMSMLFSKK